VLFQVQDGGPVEFLVARQRREVELALWPRRENLKGCVLLSDGLVCVLLLESVFRENLVLARYFLHHRLRGSFTPGFSLLFEPLKLSFLLRHHAFMRRCRKIVQCGFEAFQVFFVAMGVVLLHKTRSVVP
ncbi:MAG: hypothetical protein WBV69_23565, partial [Candidatus Sulfotelmatobacter sp.]